MQSIIRLRNTKIPITKDETAVKDTVKFLKEKLHHLYRGEINDFSLTKYIYENDSINPIIKYAKYTLSQALSSLVFKVFPKTFKASSLTVKDVSWLYKEYLYVHTHMDNNVFDVTLRHIEKLAKELYEHFRINYDSEYVYFYFRELDDEKRERYQYSNFEYEVVETNKLVLSDPNDISIKLRKTADEINNGIKSRDKELTHKILGIHFKTRSAMLTSMPVFEYDIYVAAHELLKQTMAPSYISPVLIKRPPSDEKYTFDMLLSDYSMFYKYRELTVKTFQKYEELCKAIYDFLYVLNVEIIPNEDPKLFTIAIHCHGRKQLLNYRVSPNGKGLTRI